MGQTCSTSTSEAVRMFPAMKQDSLSKEHNNFGVVARGYDYNSWEAEEDCQEGWSQPGLLLSSRLACAT